MSSLKKQYEAVQKRAFLKWSNIQLRRAGMKIDDLDTVRTEHFFFSRERSFENTSNKGKKININTPTTTSTTGIQGRCRSVHTLRSHLGRESRKARMDQETQEQHSNVGESFYSFEVP